MKRGFASDNNAPVHPLIMDALQRANDGHCIAYGDDLYTSRAVEKIKEIFGTSSEVFFVFTGTAANVLGLTAATRPFNSIVCAETAHIHTDECGAPERFTGCKILSIPTGNGKITPAQVTKHLHGFGFEHHSQPGVVSITQATELGTLYTLQEIKELAELAHANGLLLHVDGARLANAAVALSCSFGDMITGTGVDILSFGGTKNGLMYGEAIVFLNSQLAENFKYIRKQGMQLASKMRYIAAQFDAYLTNDLWKSLAEHANAMARLLAQEVAKIPGIQITQPVQANGVFAILPPEIIPQLQKEYFFYVWDEMRSEVRWMCSWDTTEEDVLRFTEILSKAMESRK
ncbi:MAG TPA: low specificity L-threonine aldolase [Bacteroidales bacterium]|nr:low specificity L-threonine aldolase [Bacteroidales bacterium]